MVEKIYVQWLKTTASSTSLLMQLSAITCIRLRAGWGRIQRRERERDVTLCDH